MRSPFCVLPIHHLKKEQYYAEMADREAAAKVRLEAAWGREFQEIPANARLFSEEMEWWRPPWLVNDTIGFAVLGWERGNDISLEYYLRRKHFPKGSHERSWPNKSVAWSNWLLHYDCEHETPDDLTSNTAWLDAAQACIVRVQNSLRKRLRSATIWCPESLRFFDFVAAISNATESARADLR